MNIRALLKFDVMEPPLLMPLISAERTLSLSMHQCLLLHEESKIIFDSGEYSVESVQFICDFTHYPQPAEDSLKICLRAAPMLHRMHPSELKDLLIKEGWRITYERTDNETVAR